MEWMLGDLALAASQVQKVLILKAEIERVDERVGGVIL